MTIFEFIKGEVIELRKVHPCGGFSWIIFSVGADISIRCNTCGHRLTLERRILERRMRPKDSANGSI